MKTNYNYNNNSWFVSHSTNSNAKVRLFCLHHSGGTASFFRHWKDVCHSQIELIAIQLPGRGRRLSEPYPTSISEIIEGIITHLDQYQDKPYIFFGHSLGGLIAFELAKEVSNNGMSIPTCLIVSARNAPQIKPRTTPLYKLDDKEFIQKVINYGGIPEEIIRDKEFIEFLTPRLKADFKISETYSYKRAAPLNCPIIALGGNYDTNVTREEIAAWKEQSTEVFSMYMFSGGHFFINSHLKQIFNILTPQILGKYKLD